VAACQRRKRAAMEGASECSRLTIVGGVRDALVVWRLGR
jgi:hypothetical protein